MAYKIYDNKKNKLAFTDEYRTEKSAKKDIVMTIYGAFDSGDYDDAIYYLDNYVVKKVNKPAKEGSAYIRYRDYNWKLHKKFSTLLQAQKEIEKIKAGKVFDARATKTTKTYLLKGKNAFYVYYRNTMWK